MKKLRTFEEYNPKIQPTIKMLRKTGDSKIFKITGKIISVIDDLIHLNPRLAIYSMKNKEGFDKLEKFTSEISILKSLYIKDDTLTFDDLENYEFNPNTIDILDDPAVIEYLTYDKSLKDSFDTTFKNLIDFLIDYKSYSKENKLK